MPTESHRPFAILATATAALVASSSPTAQSVSSTATAASAISASAFDSQRPFATQSIPMGSDLTGGVTASATVPNGVSRSSTQIAVTQVPPQLRVEVLAVSAPLIDTLGSASTGPNEVLWTLTATREFSGEVVVDWNGILQHIGNGLLSAHVDIGNDGSIEFVGNAAEVTSQEFPAAFGPTTGPLEVLVRTEARALATALQSAYFGLLTVEFAPDDESVAPGAFQPFGFGCQGSNAQSPLLIASPSGPRIGETWAVEIRNLAPAAQGVVGMISVGSLAQPVHLDVIGMPFCFLSLPPRAIVPFAMVPPVGGGTQVWNFQLPNETRLLGQRFFQQAFVIDPPANSLGAVLSNAAENTVGGGW